MVPMDAQSEKGLLMSRKPSSIAPDWWDYTTLPEGIIQAAARLTPERMLKLSRPGFKVVIYGTLEEFYLAAFARLPGTDEIQELQQILVKRGDREAGLREFVWALISSREFAENH